MRKHPHRIAGQKWAEDVARDLGHFLEGSWGPSTKNISWKPTWKTGAKSQKNGITWVTSPRIFRRIWKVKRELLGLMLQDGCCNRDNIFVHLLLRQNIALVSAAGGCEVVGWWWHCTKSGTIEIYRVLDSAVCPHTSPKVVFQPPSFGKFHDNFIVFTGWHPLVSEHNNRKSLCCRWCSYWTVAFQIAGLSGRKATHCQRAGMGRLCPVAIRSC